MKLSRRAKRMARSHERHKTPPLNLISLMDIFTILVFFILVSSSNSYQLPNAQELNLPLSKSQTTPEETLVIAVTRSEILFEGKRVAIIDDILKDQQPPLEPLKKELDYFRTQNNEASQNQKITIMSDADAPYAVLKKVLSVCQEKSYTRIAFAAMQEDKQYKH